MGVFISILKNGVAMMFAACFATAAMILVGVVVWLLFSAAKRVIRGNKETNVKVKPTKNDFFVDNLEKIFLGILFVDAILIGVWDVAISKTPNDLFLYVIAYIAGVLSAYILHMILCLCVSAIEKALKEYVELKRSVSLAFKESNKVMWVCVFVGFCVFGAFFL